MAPTPAGSSTKTRGRETKTSASNPENAEDTTRGTTKTRLRAAATATSAMISTASRASPRVAGPRASASNLCASAARTSRKARVAMRDAV